MELQKAQPNVLTYFRLKPLNPALLVGYFCLDCLELLRIVDIFVNEMVPAGNVVRMAWWFLATTCSEF